MIVIIKRIDNIIKKISHKKARSQFVQTVAELAERKANIDPLLTGGVKDLTKPWV